MCGHPDAVNFEVFKSLYLGKNLPDKHQTWGFCESRRALFDYVAFQNNYTPSQSSHVSALAYGPVPSLSQSI